MKFSIWPKLWRQAKSENDDLKKKIENQAHQLGNQGYRIHNQRKEIERQAAQNAKLKDILRECRDVIKYYQNWSINSDLENTQLYWLTSSDLENTQLLTKINEVLK